MADFFVQDLPYDGYDRYSNGSGGTDYVPVPGSASVAPGLLDGEAVVVQDGGTATDTTLLGLRGHVGVAEPYLISGWAQTVEHPETAVCLDILSDGQLIG